jgi:hypothetical protein
MKKLLILSVLLGLMALPMFASDITFGGDLTYGFIWDFDDIGETTTATFDIKAAVDDYNSLVIELNTLNDPIPDKAVVTTDVGGMFDLPVMVHVTWGWDDPDINEFGGISAYSDEEVIDVSTGDNWMLNFLLGASFVEFEMAFTPIAGAAGELLAGLAVKEPIPGLNAELYYWQGGADYADGWIIFDAGYGAEFGGVALDAGAEFVYPLLDANDWAFGVGLSAGVSIATVTVGVDGNETDTLNSVSATAELAPFDLATVYAGLWYDMAGEALREVDLGVNAHLGATELYVGYLIDGDSALGAGDNYNAPPSTGDNGLYFKFDIDY